MEILAPGGSPESVTEAVRCGADAVYLGLDALNARRGAKNFDAEALRKTARLCRARGVKIYLTLNTLLFDREIPEAAEQLRLACSCGVTAVIVQDLAAACLVRECAPDLLLYASTQMSVHNTEGVRMLWELGFRRAVLARELALDEIRRIRKDSPPEIELEVFCHGALCVCLSGRCLFSSMAGGRSGNRGCCAQPCRKPISAEGEKGGAYALSLKDLSLLTPQAMKQLRDAGVSSVKIEGRMKRPEYVAAAVTAAREAREGRNPDRKLLQRIFSREGFTDGYFTGRRGPDMFGRRTQEDLAAAKSAARSVRQEVGITSYEPESAEMCAGEPAKRFFELAPGRIPKPCPRRVPQAPAFYAFLTSASQVSGALAARCALIALYLPELTKLAASPDFPSFADRLALREPPACFDGRDLERILRGGIELGISHLVVSGLDGIRLGKKFGYTLHGDYTLNITNSIALEEYRRLGLSDALLSVELSAARCRALGGELPRGIAAFGRIPLMTFRCCPVKARVGCKTCRSRGALRDPQRRRFPVSCGSGVPQLYNCDRLELAGKLPEFRGLDFVCLFFYEENAEEAARVLERYGEHAGPDSMNGRTRGLYFRKVL